MTLNGHLLIGGGSKFGANGSFRSQDAATGRELDGEFGGATKADLAEATELAWEAFSVYRQTGLEERALFLEQVASCILDVGDRLIERCIAETGLPRGRVEGERGRTIFQLRMFADVVRDGSFLEARLDSPLPERSPARRPDLRLRKAPLGPVAVFGASNFPLAFSVAGGDTASALAAGCPVIVKAHSAHPGTSELVGKAVQEAVRLRGLPAGTFALLYDTGREISQALVADPRIRAVGFTGSRAGGTTFMAIAAKRRQPIPVYAEMSSINPVILFPSALKSRAASIARTFVSSLTQGAGQFCTNPGLILAIESESLSHFLSHASEELAKTAGATMLTSGILNSYCEGVDRLGRHPDVSLVGQGLEGDGRQCRASLFVTSGAAFLADPRLQDEVFGPSSLVVRCRDIDELTRIVDGMEGQLTVALHVDEEDEPAARRLMPKLEGLAGRILFNGFGTGVEVGHAMVHGGPFPATSDGRSTSVGSLAIERFLRPVSYQDAPAALLPDSVKDDNPLRIPRRIDGKLVVARRAP